MIEVESSIFPQNYSDLCKTSFIPRNELINKKEEKRNNGNIDSLEQMDFLTEEKVTQKTIEVSYVLESDCLRFDTTHKMWGMVNLKVNNKNVKNPYIDFVVVVDISASMLLDKKLAFVQSSIHYLLEELHETHRLALIFFNHEVSIASDLVYCTQDNKNKFISILENLQASGSTNISDALYAGNNILLNRDNSTNNRISSLILITDGLSNTGLSSEEMLTSLDQLSLPFGCVFNTFGFGEDHDSKLLHSIALKAQGVYYYISCSEHIHKIFGGCVKSLLSSRAKFVKVTLQGQDGCRIIKIATPFQAIQKEKAKDYDINVGLMYREEFKTILFKLSLRKLNKQLKQPLLKVNVQYYDIETSNIENISKELSIERRDYSKEPIIPLSLDQNLNRYSAVKAILLAIDHSNRLQFTEAHNIISECIDKIKGSSSSNINYCHHLVEDLMECKLAMLDSHAFQIGVHIAHSYASMYYMERSSGVEVKKFLDVQSKNQEFDLEAYGYLTEEQTDLVQDIKNTEKTDCLLSRYLKNT